MPVESQEERAALAAINTFRTSGSAYFLEQATRPQTLGYALPDSPVAFPRKRLVKTCTSCFGWGSASRQMPDM